MPVDHLGEIAALGTAFCWVTTALAFESAGRRIGSMTVNLLRMPLAFALLTLVARLTRGQALPSDADAHAWGWLALSGLVGFTFGDLCLFRAFVTLGARLSSLIMSLAPIFAALIGWVVLGEVLSGQDILGMMMTVIGIGWAVLDRGRPSHVEAPTRPLSGILLAIGGATGQAAGLVLSKLGMGDYSAVAATQIRVLAGFSGYLVLFMVLGWWSRIGRAMRDRRAMATTTLGSVFGPFLGVWLSLVAVKYALAGVAASIMSITPVLIIPAVVLLGREKVGWGGVGGAVLAVAGVVVLFL